MRDVPSRADLDNFQNLNHAGKMPFVGGDFRHMLNRVNLKGENLLMGIMARFESTKTKIPF
jgi:hypothetical protein